MPIIMEWRIWDRVLGMYGEGRWGILKGFANC